MTVQPHSEVVNRQPRVLIVGYGHVGQQMGRYFSEAHYMDVNDALRYVSNDIAVEDHGLYDLGFICVPTPQGYDGRCDVSIVRQVYQQYHTWALYWCIKSTVEVGTTDMLNKAALGCGGPSSENVCMSPEYYGETLGHPLAGVARDPFIILGGPEAVTGAFAEAWSLMTNSNARIIQTSARAAELCKLMENAFIAVKVSFCNEMYDLAELAGVDYNELRELWLMDPRVGRSHSYVYRENRGFGGKCIPKDTANLCAWARAQGKPASMLEGIREYNEKIRGRVTNPPLREQGA